MPYTLFIGVNKCMVPKITYLVFSPDPTIRWPSFVHMEPLSSTIKNRRGNIAQLCSAARIMPLKKEKRDGRKISNKNENKKRRRKMNINKVADEMWQTLTMQY